MVNIIRHNGTNVLGQTLEDVIKDGKWYSLSWTIDMSNAQQKNVITFL